MVELWGIYQRLLLAWEVGIRNILIEADSECAIQMIAKGCNTANACYPLIRGTKGQMDRNWRVALHHVYRESNNAADFVAFVWWLGDLDPSPSDCLALFGLLIVPKKKDVEIK